MTKAPFTYRTIKAPGAGRFQEKGSKFVATAFHMISTADLDRQLAVHKGAHPKARHVCYAYRILDREEIVAYSSDAGEPSGSAGNPILGAIASRKLVNAGVIVVRYFGGTKLGIPGLIHAYRSAAEDALDNAQTILQTRRRTYALTAPHALQPLILESCRKLDIETHNPVYDTHFRLEISVPLEDIESRLYAFLSAVAQHEYTSLSAYLETLDMTLEARDEHT